MRNYPTLTEMGICCPEQIKRYSMTQTSKSSDMLRILYKREKGSLLPQRKTFKFGRSAKMMKANSSGDGTREVFEISPFLQKAAAELDQLLGTDHTSVDVRIKIAEEIDWLEKESQERITHLRRLLGQV